MGTRLGIGACFFACVLISSPANADVIVDNGNPDATSYGSNSTVELSLNPDWTAFDDFTLDEGNNVLTDIHWWGNYYLYYSDQVHDGFQVYIYGDTGGSPDLDSGALHTIDGSSVIRTGTGTVASENDESPIFAYDLYFDPIALDPNVTYWLAITNGFYWYWQPSMEQGASYQVVGNDFPGDIATWKDQLDVREYNLAFNLTGGVVPEPSTIVLLGAGLAAVIVRQRMRKA